MRHPLREVCFRAELAAELLCHLGLEVYISPESRRIHLLDFRMENYAAALFLEKAAVMLEVSRIAVEILADAELRRVYEYGCHNAVTL